MEPPSLPPENSESAPTTNKMAIASLTLIIIAFVAAFFALFFFGGTWVWGPLAQTAYLTPFILIICGLICGHIARRQIRNAEGRERGEGMALAGLILGYCPILILLAFLIFLIIAASTIPTG